MSEKVYLVDGSGYIFRAFYAIAHLTNSQGFPTNGLYGFLRMLQKLMKEAVGGHIVVVFDAGRKTFRNDLYADYKANRSEPPPELVKQFPYFSEFSEALGLPVLKQVGFEADDIIGTLADRCRKAGHEVVVVSGDKDLLQLVQDGVTVWDTMKDKRYRAPEVKEKFGVPPDKVVEVLGLIGDDSDNIPGMKGVGPKTATQLIEKFGSVEAVLNSADAIRSDASIRNRNKIAELIESEREIVRLSRKLVEIDRNAPVEIPQAICARLAQANGSSSGQTVSVVKLADLSDAELLGVLTRGEPHADTLGELVKRFEFGSLIAEFNLKSPAKREALQVDYRTIYNDDFDKWVGEISSKSEFAFDVETTSLDPLLAKLVGASFCWADDHAFYIPLGHAEVPAGHSQVPLEKFLAALADIFRNPKVAKIGQNLKYDCSILGCAGLEVAGVAFDTMLASYVLAPDRGSHNLTVLAKEFLDSDVIEYDEVVGEKSDFSYVPIDAATRYAGQDAHFAWLLKRKMEPLIKEKGLERVLYEIEVPLVPILSRMERTGISLDLPRLSAMSVTFGKELETIQAQIFQVAGGEFNINSPKQLAEVLFERLGISTKGLKKTKTGISTDSSVLEKLADVHPLPALILKFRTIHKLKSTYVDALPAQVSAISGRLHTRLNQAVTGTGRLSSSDPNLQNIPIQTAEGRQIREAFIADPARGTILISADYSQIELRVLAHLSGDEKLIQAFADGIDIHAKTAREIMGLTLNFEITPEQRRIGKTINFGVIYGMSGFRLARDLEIPVRVANEYIENYFAQYPRVREFFASVERESEESGYVSTLFGRKRFVAQLDLSGRDQGFARRAAMNAPLQGTAADIMKLAMIRVDQQLAASKLPIKMLLQIHDELLFECEGSAREEAVKIIKDAMEHVATLKVPLEVDVGWGKNWQEAHA